MKILVTGSRGFIARNIAEKVNVLSPDINVLRYDLLKEFILKNKVNTIIHTAITQDIYCNMAMLTNILRLPVKKIITFGSGCQYNQYPKSPSYKLFKELQAKMVENDERVINLILYGVYGKYEPVNDTFISSTIISKLENKPFHINKQRRMSYLYIDDLVEIVKHFLKYKVKYRLYDIVPNKSYLLTEIASLITSNFTIGKGLDKPYIGDNRRLLNELPNFKFTSIGLGIKHLTKYYVESRKNN